MRNRKQNRPNLSAESTGDVAAAAEAPAVDQIRVIGEPQYVECSTVVEPVWQSDDAAAADVDQDPAPAAVDGRGTDLQGLFVTLGIPLAEPAPGHNVRRLDLRLNPWRAAVWNLFFRAVEGQPLPRATSQVEVVDGAARAVYYLVDVIGMAAEEAGIKIVP